MLKVEDAIATPFENLDLVVESFHKAAALALNEKVGGSSVNFVRTLKNVRYALY
jgi:hypothetical protein